MNNIEIQAAAKVLAQYVPIEQSGDGFYTEQDVNEATKTFEANYRKRKNSGRKPIEYNVPLLTDDKGIYRFELHRVEKHLFKIFVFLNNSTTPEATMEFKSFITAEREFPKYIKEYLNGNIKYAISLTKGSNP